MEQLDVLRYTLDVLDGLDAPYMLVGSFASIAFGEARLTHDIDIVIDLSERQVAAFCDSFPEPEFYLSGQAVRDAVRTRTPFNVIHPTSGNKIDFMLPRDDEWGRQQLLRRQRVQIIADREGFVARPEDVILGKLWYYSEGGSEKHMRDIAGMLRVSGDRIDRDDIARWAEKLGLSEIWKAVLERASGSDA